MALSQDVEAMIERLRTHPSAQKLREMIDSVSSEVHAYEPAPNEWSFIRMLRHLGDVEEMRHTRLRRMLEEENPILDVVPPTPGERDTDQVDALLDRWIRSREKSVAMVSGLTEEQWHRVGTQNPDPQVNRTSPALTTVIREAHKIDLHAENHLRQMQDNVDSYDRSKQAGA